MKFLKDLMKSEKRHSLVLEILFVIYIIFDIDMPFEVAKVVDTTMGNVAVVLLALTMFAAAGPIAGVLALLAAHTLIKRASVKTGGMFMYNSGEAEEIKMQELQKYNEIPKTLEEEVVSTMAPIVHNSGSGSSDVVPVLGNLQDAAPIDYECVI